MSRYLLYGSLRCRNRCPIRWDCWRCEPLNLHLDWQPFANLLHQHDSCLKRLKCKKKESNEMKHTQTWKRLFLLSYQYGYFSRLNDNIACSNRQWIVHARHRKIKKSNPTSPKSVLKHNVTKLASIINSFQSSKSYQSISSSQRGRERGGGDFIQDGNIVEYVRCDGGGGGGGGCNLYR